MFEDALLESSHRIKTRSGYWSLGALLINSGALLALVIWPLLHPQALPSQVMTSLLVAPAPPTPLPAMPVAKPVVRLRTLDKEIDAPSKVPHSTNMVTDSAELQQEVANMRNGQDMSGTMPSDGFNRLLDGMEPGRPAVRAAAPAGKSNVSSGVMAGNLMEKTSPQYPVIAREAHVQGTVILQATIGRGGEIQNLRVISGPPLLRQAALDAVRSWRYKPYLLNGNPVAVETTVSVIFGLGN